MIVIFLPQLVVNHLPATQEVYLLGALFLLHGFYLVVFKDSWKKHVPPSYKAKYSWLSNNGENKKGRTFPEMKTRSEFVIWKVKLSLCLTKHHAMNT